MPTVSEADLADSEDPNDCIQCPDFEGSIWLCGEGYICERCFSDLSGTPEEQLYGPEDVPMSDFEVPPGPKEKVKEEIRRRRDGED